MATQIRLLHTVHTSYDDYDPLIFMERSSNSPLTDPVHISQALFHDRQAWQDAPHAFYDKRTKTLGGSRP